MNRLFVIVSTIAAVLISTSFAFAGSKAKPAKAALLFPLDIVIINDTNNVLHDMEHHVDIQPKRQGGMRGNVAQYTHFELLDYTYLDVVFEGTVCPHAIVTIHGYRNATINEEYCDKL